MATPQHPSADKMSEKRITFRTAERHFFLQEKMLQLMCCIPATRGKDINLLLIESTNNTIEHDVHLHQFSLPASINKQKECNVNTYKHKHASNVISTFKKHFEI